MPVGFGKGSESYVMAGKVRVTGFQQLSTGSTLSHFLNSHKGLANSIHQELIMKRVLTLAIVSILASAMAFAQESSSSTSTSGSSQQTASTPAKKGKKAHAKKHDKKAKASKSSATSTTENPSK